MRMTEQLLRSAWNLSIQSEADEIGELEISLESWQYRYLFDLRQHDKPNYQHLVQPQLLLGRSEVLPHKADAVMRIVARRRDAEEIANLIREDLCQFGRIELDLNTFKSLLGKPGWPNSLDQLFSETSLRFIEEHTLSIIEAKAGNLVHIYNKSEIAREHTKRLLLSLLPLPLSTSIDVYYAKENREASRYQTSDPKPCSLPQAAQSGLHLRHRALQLYRLAVPTAKSIDKTSFGDNEGCSKYLQVLFHRAFPGQLSVMASRLAL